MLSTALPAKAGLILSGGQLRNQGIWLPLSCLADPFLQLQAWLLVYGAGLNEMSGIWNHNHGFDRANGEVGYRLEIQRLAIAVSSEPRPFRREEKAN